MLSERRVAADTNSGGHIADRYGAARKSLNLYKDPNKMNKRLVLIGIISLPYLVLNSLADPVGQGTEPRPVLGQTSIPLSSPSKQQTKHEKGLNLDVQQQPEPRPSPKSNLTKLATHRNPAGTVQGAESRPSGNALPGSAGTSNTSTAKQTSKPQPQQVEPRPSGSPKPKSTLRRDE